MRMFTYHKIHYCQLSQSEHKSYALRKEMDYGHLLDVSEPAPHNITVNAALI